MKLVVRANEAAEMLQTSQAWVLDELNSGRMPGYRSGRNWSIPVKLLEEYIEEKARSEAERRKECQKESK